MALNGIPARRGVGCLAFWLPEGLPGDRDRGDLGWKEHEGVDAEQWVDGTEGRWGTWSALGKVAAPLVLPRSRIFSWRRWKGGWCASLDVLVATGHLPLIQVDTVGRDFWVPQEIPNEPKVPCRLRGWFPEGEPCSQGWWGAGVEGRGKRLEKWKYGFRLDQSVSLAGMRSSRHWVLESAFSEGTLLRPRLAYELARVLPLRHGEMPLAPETRYVDLVVNGGYQGVFLLMEHVDENFLHFPRHNPLNDYPALLFRGKDDNALIAPENVEREVRGAYRALPGGRTPLFKGDDPIHGWHNGYAQRFPEPEGFGYFWQPLDEWLLFLNMSSTPDFERVVAQKMDMDAFRDLWVWTQAIDDGDGLGKNRYWAREEGRMARWFVIPWDKDGVLGRDQGGGARPAEGWLHTSLLDRCLAIPSFREGFRARWLSLRTGAWSDEALQKLFDGARGALGGAWRRDVARWPKRSGALWTPERYQSEVAAILPWIRDRWRWLDELVRYL